MWQLQAVGAAAAHNIRSVKKYSKHSSNTLLCLGSFFYRMDVRWSKDKACPWMIWQQLCLTRIFGDRPSTYFHPMNFILFLACENSTTIIHLGVCVHLAKIWQITPSVTPSPTSLIAHFMWHFLKESRELAEKIFQPPRIFMTGRHAIPF